MRTMVEYLWIDGSTPTAKLRSKTKIVEFDTPPTEIGKFPIWGFDGSSTRQAKGDASDCVLKPVCFIEDPVRVGDDFTYSVGGVDATVTFANYIVLCEVETPDGQPHETNTRQKLREVLDKGATEHEGWFSFEQEYTFFKGASPLGFPGDRRHPAAQGPYYCGVGADEVYGRPIVEAHASACIKAGLLLSGINAEVMPGQWEYQIGVVSGMGHDYSVTPDALTVSDHLWLSRYLLYRIAEDFGVSATLDPKPVPGDWNGAGMHTNFSTKEMRGDGGIEVISNVCHALRTKIQEHLTEYGDGIEMRLTGKHETCRFDEFKFGVSDRTAAIRIPWQVSKDGKGYLEDRRPNANADPYRVTARMLKTACNID